MEMVMMMIPMMPMLMLMLPMINLSEFQPHSDPMMLIVMTMTNL